MARLELAASWSQTRRPTNWATPGYKIKRKCSLWSNMWSRKFYHSFAQLSTEVIAGFHRVTREYATFREVEPFWCSSSQSKRSPCCGARYLPRRRRAIVSYRPQPLAQVAESAAGGAPFAPQTEPRPGTLHIITHSE